ncbi:RtcB family protein [Algoriphagus sp. CAU 1675]|uniref:RtcB family protein n=1 Tax=Algoriphagus sp. CAU 1675 TaxID=3032597 RepID=UPI0023D9A2E9|nr:RtcB family protein [Algoriphagus sp. CAU 1675]MDF2157174.1 RtcB family protein [Algoriphagus sp. CAU 1675]
MDLKQHIQKVDEYLWEIPQKTREGMRVPAQIYASDKLMQELGNDNSLEQLTNVAMLPGIKKASIVMPDVHEGYGFPIGGVAATEWPHGVISPGGIGYDINCGVRILCSELERKDLKNRGEELAKALYAHIPSGVGKGGSLHLDESELDKVLRKGAQWALENGFAEMEDIEHIESNGCLKDADPDFVSEYAKKRGADQLGTIGSGNHFLEVSYVDEIFDSESARAFGLKKNQLIILIHTGSRGLGHQIASDYLKQMVSTLDSYHIQLPDRELACAPFDSKDGQAYFKAMAAAANFAWCNRQVITSKTRELWREFFGKEKGGLRLLYDVAHNIAKVEEHIVDGKKIKLIIHRKGSTRSFGPHNPEIPEALRSTGQPVIIPGSMGTASYVMVGTQTAMEKTFGSTCHGAGRRMSRHAATRNVNIHNLEKELLSMDIHVRAGSRKGVSEEAPIAYKDIEEVINVVHNAEIARKVARLKPMVVIKG